MAGQNHEQTHAAAQTAEAARPNGSDAPRDAEAERADRRALVIDDEAGIRRFTRLLLGEVGFDVTLAADGNAGLAHVRSETPLDLVLLDVTMPGMSGVEVLEALRLLELQLPVVLMSGYHEDDLDRVLAADPFTRFLQKPFSAESLWEAIGAVRPDDGLANR